MARLMLEKKRQKIQKGKCQLTSDLVNGLTLYQES